MTKEKIKILEQAFAAEIDDRLPMQSKSKLMLQLEHEGMVEKMSRTFGRRGRFPVIVDGWVLTELGRYTYCKWAAKNCPKPRNE